MTGVGCGISRLFPGEVSPGYFFLTKIRPDKNILFTRFSGNENEQQKKDLIVQSSSTSSDWQLGHIGRLPTPLNRSPHSLQR
jgi:hypothetical protein